MIDIVHTNSNAITIAAFSSDRNRQPHNPFLAGVLNNLRQNMTEYLFNDEQVETVKARLRSHETLLITETDGTFTVKIQKGE